VRVFALGVFLISTLIDACDHQCDGTASDDQIVDTAAMTANGLSQSLAQQRIVAAVWRPPDTSSSGHGFTPVAGAEAETLTFSLEVPPTFHISGEAHLGDACDSRATSGRAVLHVTSDSGRVNGTLRGSVRIYGDGVHFTGAEPAEGVAFNAPGGGDGKVYLTLDFNLRDMATTVAHFEASVRRGSASYVFLAST
jgi:hypothetical protein